MTPARTPISVLSFLASGILAAVIACDKNPAGPSEPPPPKVSLQALTIDGLRPMQNPGEVLQLSATATYSDGSTRDVTASVSWVSNDVRVVTIRPDGLLTTTGYGTGDIRAYIGPTGPQATASVRVMPEGMFLVKGVVMAEGQFRLSDVTVSVTSADATVIRTTTDVTGIFRLPGRGDVVVRAEKAGYSLEQQSAVVEHDIDISFELDRLQDYGSIAGSYTLVFTASPSCRLPAEVTRRQYTARIYEPELLWVELSGADMEAWGWAGFTGTRDASTVHFDIYDRYSLDLDNEAVFVERLDPQRNLAFSGVATGTIDERSVVATFDGRVQVRSVGGSPPTVSAECTAADHRLEFARVDPARRR